MDPAGNASEKPKVKVENGGDHGTLALAQPPAKRSKKGKKKHQGQASAADYLKVTPLSREADLLREENAHTQLSKSEKAQQMTLSEDKLSVTSHKGYRMARATRGVHKGTWYFEIRVTHLGPMGHCRLGWSTKKGELQAPVGYDEHSFGYRDLEGSKVHKALREEYGKPYREGDVIGCFIHMPEGGRRLEKSKADLLIMRGRPYVPEEPEPEPNVLPGSCVAFTCNGELQGVAYRDMNEGTYYPAVSLYTLPEQQEGATVTFNFGPDLAFGMPEIEGYPSAQPYSAVQQLMQDEMQDAVNASASEHGTSHAADSQQQNREGTGTPLALPAPPSAMQNGDAKEER
ncbi:g12986 [Coccomyxa viridis]|uniref:G12986 protein n=1 Tax=Coccomyxa viridis TaxID=1274662 RepID=A0ABP1GEB7_9CHLO